MDNKAAESYLYRNSEARGREDRQRERKFALAKKMLAKNKTIDEIIDFTDLSKKQIENLR